MTLSKGLRRMLLMPLAGFGVMGWTCVCGAAVDTEGKEKRQTWDEYMTVDLNAPVEELALPADAEARRKVFAERFSPAAVEKAAKELFALWDFGESRSSKNPATQEFDSEKKRIAALYAEKKYEEALTAYRTYLVHKTTVLWNAKPTYSGSGYNGRFSGQTMTKRYADVITLLMQDRYQTCTTKTTVHIGEPGLIHWEWKAKELQNPWDNLYRPELEYFCGSDYDKLLWKFLDTHERKYLDKWLAALDDYCLNHHVQEDLSALNLDLGKTGASDALGFLFALCELSRATAEGAEQVPAVTVARMMAKQAGVIIPQSLFYNRQQSNNHSPGTTAAFLRLSEFFYDFKIARTIEVEGRRQFENYGTLSGRPDGVGPGRLPSYAMFEFKENQPILAKFREEEYEWFTPMLNREYRDRMLARARYMIGMHSMNGEQIVTQKTDRRGTTFSDMAAYFNRMLPELYDEPAMMKVVNRIIRNQTEATWNGRVFQQKEKPIARMGMGSPSDDEPEYSSYGYPYDRVFVMSSGWSLTNDQYGVFLGSSVRGRGDSFMKENKASNHFNLSAFDEDLFNNGVDYAYNYLRSPVTVDDQTQFNGAGEGPTSRRGMGNFGFDPVCQDRIHFSPHFDMVEGLYDGAYANTGDHNPDYYDCRNKTEALKRCIWGCSHRRIVNFVKRHGIWIVTDVMTSDKPHDYAQQWWLGLFNKELPEGFDMGQFQTHTREQTMTLVATNRPCFTMYHAGPADLDKPGAAIGGLTYAPVGLKKQLEDSFKGSRADRHEGREYIELKGSWKSQGGRSQVITVIQPHKSKDAKPLELTRLARPDGQINGLTARLNDGAEVAYVAAFGKPEPMTAGGLCAVAESLLVLTEADGTRRGTALGCLEMRRTGWFARNVHPATADFEFTWVGSEIQMSPIYRPIGPVEFGPVANVFVDTVSVAMTTKTEGTEIRYTVDGSDPTLASRLYTGPVTFKSTVMVKARAFRKGLKQMPPPTETGVEMTTVCMAVYTKDEYHAANTWNKELKAGLLYEYFEAKWPLLLFGPNRDSTPALKRGEVPALFDISPRGANAGKAFAFAYEGYLQVPEDGVYTLYAPREFSDYRPLAGYDLSVWLGYQNRSYDGKSQKLGGGSPCNAWYPATRRHAFGTWSVALKKGLQPLRVYYADIRPGAKLQYLQFEYPDLNVPGLTKITWDGAVPKLEISGPNLTRQSIPKAWFKHD